MDDGGPGCGRRASWPVCSKPKGDTAQGLCDMIGNVIEWVADSPDDGTRRFFRGGSWYHKPAHLTALRRGDVEASGLVDDLGFRPVRPPERRP
jgi:formylglycine-generating enzyme required for sulfatase activity